MAVNLVLTVAAALVGGVAGALATGKQVQGRTAAKEEALAVGAAQER